MRQTVIVASTLFTIIVVTMLSSGNLQAAEAEATLKIKRQTPVFRYNTIEVYINGKKVGTVGQGKMAEFKFEPVKDENTLSFTVVGLLGNLKTGKTKFTAKPASVSNVLLTNGTGASKFECIVDITAEKTKVAPIQKSEAEVKFEEKVVDKDVFTEPYETIPGVSRTFTVERSCERSMTVTGTVGVEVGAKATLGAEAIASISGEIKTKVEASLGITLGKKESVTESITLDGKDVTKVNVKWVERYRKGTATLADGRKVEVLVRVGLRLKVEKSK